jgi:hypothetical protein
MKAKRPDRATGGTAPAGAEAVIHGEEHVVPEAVLRDALAAAAGTYRATNGFNYPGPEGPSVRVEAGETGLVLPEAVVTALLGSAIEKE